MTEFYTNAVNELRNIYNKLNADYYNDELPEVVITIQSSPKGKAYGWFGANRWGQGKIVEDDEFIKGETEENSTLYHEINISAEYLARPINNIISTLQHEMVHLYCKENSIKDTSNKNVYHNLKFKEEAEKRGLHIEQAKTIGWSVTTPTEEFIDYIKELNIDENVFTFFRKMPAMVKKNTEKNDVEKKKTTKYICPTCGAVVRGEIGLEIECRKCEEIMESKK